MLIGVLNIVVFEIVIVLNEVVKVIGEIVEGVLN